MGGGDGTLEQRIARIADEQHGNVTRRQLLSADIGVRAIERRLDKGSLIRVYEGVYRVGHSAPSRCADCMAAVLAAGDEAGLVGRPAAHLLGLIKGPPPPLEVAAPVSRVVEGVIVHRWRNVVASDLTKHKGIAITTPARTLVDLARVAPPAELAGAVHEAGIRYGTTPEEIEKVLDRMRTSKGAGKLRAILRGDIRITASKLERAFLRLLKEAKLPLPRTNIRAGGRFVDCRWPEYKLTVEIDSYRYHSSRHAWERDRKRERQAYARGDQFRRYTYDDITKHRRPVIKELRPLLRPQSPS